MPINSIYGTNSADTITGTAEADEIFGGYGADVLHGGDGNDVLNAGSETDQLFGDAGDDVLNNNGDSFAGRELFDGGTGNDTAIFSFYYRTHTVDLATGQFTDSTGKAVAKLVSIENLTYSGSNLTLAGTTGDNALSVNSSTALINADAGNDVISLAAHSAAVDGGDGTDWLLLWRDYYFAPADYKGFTVSLAAAGVVQQLNPGWDSALTISNIENLAGSDIDDRLTGNDAANVIAGLAGNDTLVGGAGNDTLIGDSISTLPVAPWTRNPSDLYYTWRKGAVSDDLLEGGLGNDRLVGGAGFDTISYAHASGSVTVDLSTGTSSGADGIDRITTVEAVIGSAYGDQLIGNSGNNRLDGGGGADTMTGGAGDDTYVVNRANDVIVEQADGGNDTVVASLSWSVTGNIENITLSGSANIDATGDDRANVLTGNSGINHLTGGAGDDIYVIRNAGYLAIEAVDGGHDTVRTIVTATLAANVEDLVLDGASAIGGTGNDLANKITGNSANNRIDGAAGADTMIGGLGNDTYIVDDAHDRAVETANDFYSKHTDTVLASVSYKLGAFVENLTLTGDAAINAIGNDLDNVVTGNDAANILRGGYGYNTLIGNGGNDTLISDSAVDKLTGGAGDDTYVLNTGSAAYIREDVDGGIDTQKSVGNISLGKNIENGIYLGTGPGLLYGNELDNKLTGGTGADLLDGRAGADTIVGGAGDDAYYVDNIGDRVVETSSGGTNDIIYATVDYTLPSYVETLHVSGTHRANGNAQANTLYGDSLANTLDGRGGADTMDGGDGDDTYYIDNAGDVVVEQFYTGGTDQAFSSIDYSLLNNGLENLTLTGQAIRAEGNFKNNILVGNAQDNEIIGNGGYDTMRGGAGNDHYVISDAATVITEVSGGGTDTVSSSVSFTLPAYVENLVLEGNDPIDGTGNALANTITGNQLDNRIDGLAGADTMIGGGGFDTFVVDNAGDQVRGTGSIEASVSFTLANGLVDLKLTGTGAIDGTGNDAANTITGNVASNQLAGFGGNDILLGNVGDDRLDGGSGNDRLDGGTGADAMNGGAGDDTYVVDNVGDAVSESGGDGRDRVIASASVTLGAGIEGGVASTTSAITITGNADANAVGGNNGNDTLDGLGGNDILIGLGGQDTLLGGAGDDLLIGGGENDKLTGGAGRDSFVGFTDGFNAAPIQITDFVSGTDRLLVDNPFLSGQLLAGGFAQGTSAKDADDIAIYDKASGQLWADIDGNGTGTKVLVATFTPGTALAASDILLIDQASLDSQIGDVSGWLYGALTL